jgi:deoxyribodipyrimidine photo-lyase
LGRAKLWRRARAHEQHKARFADELLGWREWFHYQARQLDVPERCDRVAGWAKQTLADHAGDRRPDEETLAAMLGVETRNEIWNACQRQSMADEDAQQLAHVVGQADHRDDI